MQSEVEFSELVKCNTNCGCGDFNCSISPTPFTFWDNVLYILISSLIIIGIIAVISFLITLGFYFAYKYKKDPNPRKHAFKRSWPSRIIITCIVIGSLIYLFWS